MQVSFVVSESRPYIIPQASIPPQVFQVSVCFPHGHERVTSKPGIRDRRTWVHAAFSSRSSSSIPCSLALLLLYKAIVASRLIPSASRHGTRPFLPRPLSIIFHTCSLAASRQKCDHCSFFASKMFGFAPASLTVKSSCDTALDAPRRLEENSKFSTKPHVLLLRRSFNEFQRSTIPLLMLGSCLQQRQSASSLRTCGA